MSDTEEFDETEETTDSETEETESTRAPSTAPAEPEPSKAQPEPAAEPNYDEDDFETTEDTTASTTPVTPKKTKQPLKASTPSRFSMKQPGQVPGDSTKKGTTSSARSSKKSNRRDQPEFYKTDDAKHCGTGKIKGVSESAKDMMRGSRITCEKDYLRSRRSDDPNNPLRLHSYNMHRYRIQTAKPVVDTSSPLVAKNVYSQPTAFNRRLASFSRIERENAILLRRIAQILEGQGRVGNRLAPESKCINNRGRARQLELLKVTFGNLALLKRIQEVQPVYNRMEQLKEYQQREAEMERLSYYPLFWKMQKPKGWEAHEERALSYAQDNPTMNVFLQLGTDTECMGRLIIELNYAVCPMTCENFRCLCTGELGLSYKCSTIHRIIPDILWQGGDITGNEGLGNKSIYGDTFPDENFKLTHDSPGTISMANCGPDTNGSQFLITARATHALDRSNVVFGKCVGGMGVLKNLLKLVGATGKPKQKIYILNSGVIPDGEDIEGELDKDDEAEDQEGGEEEEE